MSRYHSFIRALRCSRKLRPLTTTLPTACRVQALEVNPVIPHSNRIITRTCSTSAPRQKLPETNIIKSVVPDAEGRQLMVKWFDNTESKFHAQWLRLNCRCHVCYCHDSNSFQFPLEEITMKVYIDRATVEGDEVKIVWKGDKHESVFKHGYLREYDYTGVKFQQKNDEIAMKFTDDTTSVPEIAWPDVSKDQSAFYKYLLHINQKGLCLLKGVPTEDRYLVHVISKIGPLTDTIYGEIWDVYSKETPDNFAYTAKSLGFHMDLSFYEAPPGIQFLHCLRFDDSILGGNTIFIDMYHMVDGFRRAHPEAFDILTKTPFTFCRIHYDRQIPVHLEARKTLISVNNRREVISINWHSAEHGPALLPEGQMEPALEAYQLFARAITAFPHRYSLRLQPGDIISFNNRRMAHARESFQVAKESIRHLQGSYANLDEYKSMLIYLARKLDNGRPIQRVGNSDW